MGGYAKMITLYAGALAAALGVWVAADQLGIRPVFNYEVDAAEARVVEQITDLSKFSVEMGILTLQNERRYYRELLEQAEAEHRARPSPALMATIRLHKNTLADIQRQINGLRNK